jgi:hypothetical protein
MRLFNHLRIAGLGAAIITAALLVAGCDQTVEEGDSFVPVTDISGGLPPTVKPGVEINLNDWVSVTPDTATVKTITWSITNSESLGLTAEAVAEGVFTPEEEGTMTVTAKVQGGVTLEEDFEKEWTIEVSAGSGQDEEDQVITLNVTSAESGIMNKGAARQFTAEVRVNGAVVTKPVTWIVEGSEAADSEDDPPSSISAGGLLTIAETEAGISLSVKAVCAGMESSAVPVKVKGWKAVTSIQNIFGTSAINGIAYGAGKWVAVSGDKMAASVDGEEWAEIPITGAGVGDLNNVVYDGPASGKKFIALGGNFILSSPDGVTWTTHTFTADELPTTGGPGFNFRFGFYGAAYGNNMFIAVGNTNGEGVSVATSENGTSWTWIGTPTALGTFATAPAVAANQIVSNGSNFIVPLGNYFAIAKTTNVTDMTLAANIANGSNPTLTLNGYGESASGITPFTFLDKALFTGSQWIVAGNQGGKRLAISADPTSWTVVTNNALPDGIGAFAYGDNKLVIGGAFNNNSIKYTSLPVSAESTWSSLEPPEGSPVTIKAIVHGDNKFIVAGAQGKMIIAHEETLD